MYNTNLGCYLRAWVLLGITDSLAPGKVVLWAVIHVAISLSSSGNVLLSLEFVSKGIVSWPLNKWMFFSAVISDYSVLSYAYSAMFFCSYNINI